MAKANPLRKKVASTALRAVSSTGLTVPVENVTRDTLSEPAVHLAHARTAVT